MRKTLGYRFFGIGKVPPVSRAMLEDEGIEVMDEGIRVTVGYRHYKAPGKRFSHKSTRGRGSIVLTRRRLIGFAYSHRILNVQLDDPRFATLRAHLDQPSCLAIEIDPSVFHPDQSGTVVYRFYTSKAVALLEGMERAQSS